MRLPGRLAAAIEVLADVDSHKRPVSEALKAWGLANRFAGAGDRAAIGNLVYDALRHRASYSWIMGEDSPRALILAVAILGWGEDPSTLNASFAADRFAPVPVTEAEMMRLGSAEEVLAGAPDHVRADVPDWLAPSLMRAFGDSWVDEGSAMTGRPALDLRVNVLKSSRNRVLKSLARFHPELTTHAPHGVRMPAGNRDARTPNVQADEGYIKGWFEIQDEGSQIVSEIIGARAGEQVLDLCAGGGGKTLAMAARMGNHGQIFAYDADRSRLAPIYDRLKRNGVRNTQVRAPGPGVLDDLEGRLDRVVVDAPCTGTGTWRRRPDTKWKLGPEQLAQRVDEQRAILGEAARFVKPGGALVYITCSLLPEENGEQIARFLADNSDFAAGDPAGAWSEALPGIPVAASLSALGLTLTPRLTGTDGFFIATMRRRNA